MVARVGVRRAPPPARSAAARLGWGALAMRRGREKGPGGRSAQPRVGSVFLARGARAERWKVFAATFALYFCVVAARKVSTARTHHTCARTCRLARTLALADLTPQETDALTPVDAALSLSLAQPLARPPHTRTRIFLSSFASPRSPRLHTRQGVSIVKARLLAEAVVDGPHALAVVDTSYLMAYTIGSFAAAPLASVVGERGVLCAGGASSGVFGVLVSQLVPSSGGARALTLLWGIVGLTQGMIFPTCMALLNNSFPEHVLASVMGVWLVSCHLGGAAGNVGLSGHLQHHGWRSCFSIPGWFVTFLSAAAWAAVPVVGRSRQQSENHAMDVGHLVGMKRDRRGALARMLATLELPFLRSVALAYFILKLIRFVLLFWLPFFLHKVVRLEDHHASVVASAFEWGSVLGCALSGVLVDKFVGGRRYPVLLPMLLLFAVSMGGMALWAASAEQAADGIDGGGGILASLGRFLSGARAVALLFVAGFAVAGPDNFLSGLIPRDLANGGDIAATVGVVDGVGALGSVLQGAVTSSIAHTYGWAALFKVLAWLALCSVVALVPAARAERKGVKAKGSALDLHAEDELAEAKVVAGEV